MRTAQGSPSRPWAVLLKLPLLMTSLRLFTVIALLLIPTSAQAMSGLGVSISFERSSQTSAELAGSLWVGVEQGNQATRTLYIQSLSDDTEQVITLGIYDRISNDGQLETDYSKPSRITPWVTFDPAVPVVKPGEKVAVKMTVLIPEDSPDQAFQTVLNVNASANQSSGDSTGGTKAIIKTSIAVETDFWLGIGDALDLAPKFEILSVDGLLLDDQKYVRVFFENTGILTIEPEGRLQLSDPVFQDRVFDPVDFRGDEIFENQTGFVDVPVSNELEDGLYRAFVTAESGGVRQTKLFEGELVFDAPNPFAFMDIILRVGLFLIGSIGLVFAVRVLRKKNPPKEPKTMREKDQTPPAPQYSAPPIPREPETEIELDEWAENLRKSLREIRLDSQRIVEKYEVPETPKKKTATKTASKPAAKKTATKNQPAKTNRKTEPTSPRSKRQSKATESKK